MNPISWLVIWNSEPNLGYQMEDELFLLSFSYLKGRKFVEIHKGQWKFEEIPEGKYSGTYL